MSGSHEQCSGSHKQCSGYNDESCPDDLHHMHGLMWAWDYNAVMTHAIHYSWQEAKILCNFIITFFLLISCWGIEHSLHSLSVHRSTLPLLLPGQYQRRWTVLFLDWGPTRPWRRGRVSKRPPLDLLGTYTYEIFPMVEHHYFAESVFTLCNQTYSTKPNLFHEAEPWGKYSAQLCLMLYTSLDPPLVYTALNVVH